MASFLSTLFASWRSKRDEKLAIETGYKTAHQYLTCYRALEHEHDLASLSNEERYIRIVAHIQEAQAHEVTDPVLRIMLEPPSHQAAQVLAESRVSTAHYNADNLSENFRFAHVVELSALMALERLTGGIPLSLTSGQILTVRQVVHDVIPDDL